ncbi:MAG: hypothetical protein AABW87_02965 [Nanoarchaeota archaeon]
MKYVKIAEKEYKKLKERSRHVEELLVELVKGLEDVKNGKIRPWEK